MSGVRVAADRDIASYPFDPADAHEFGPEPMVAKLRATVTLSDDLGVILDRSIATSVDVRLGRTGEQQRRFDLDQRDLTGWIAVLTEALAHLELAHGPLTDQQVDQ